MKKFYFHYNKPKSLSLKKPQISIHYDKKCYIVDNLICKVNTKGKINKRQPYFVMTGSCSKLTIEDGIGILE